MTSTPSRSLADERGSILIEVLVSAVLVAVIGVALFGALNSAAQVSGKSKTRAGAAASLAQDDQERMRAMPVATRQQLPRAPRQVVSGQDRLRRRLARRVDRRRHRPTDCTANGAAADYLKITSTVSAKNIPLKPVVVTSTVTPAPGTFTSDEGSLAVAVVGADGTGVARRQRARSTAPPATSSSPTPTAAPSSATSRRRLQRHRRRLGLRRPQRQRDRHGHVVGRQPDGRHPVAHLRPGGQATANFATRPRRPPRRSTHVQGSVGFANAGLDDHSDSGDALLQAR